MGFRRRLHKWFVHVWEEPFFKVELMRAKVLTGEKEEGNNNQDKV